LQEKGKTAKSQYFQWLGRPWRKEFRKINAFCKGLIDKLWFFRYNISRGNVSPFVRFIYKDGPRFLAGRFRALN
jgi:hypothetical protein